MLIEAGVREVVSANGRAAYFSYSVGKGFLLYPAVMRETLDWISPP